MSKFYNAVLEGNKIKDLIRVLLEKSGYLVVPYGYESTLSNIKRKLNVKDAKNSRTVRRIRSSLDLLVYDDEEKDLMLVEVKMRRARKETRVLIYAKRIANIKEFWSDSILVVVVPSGNVFYAQKVSELEIKETYNAIKDFEKFQNVFIRVKTEDLSHFKTKALQIMKR